MKGINTMTFKDIEIRQIENTPKFEVVKWHDKERKSCFVIAFLEWNPKQQWFEFRSVGTRFLEYSPTNLNEYILAWCNMYKIIMMNEDEQDVE